MHETESKQIATILCIDDEPANLYFRKLILEQQGYRVETATNAADGLTQMWAVRPDLLITDHLLGRETGAAMVREVRKKRPGMPIILLSGSTEIPPCAEYADVFLSKTEGPRILIDTVRRLLAAAREGHKEPASETGEPSAAPDIAAPQQLLAAVVQCSDDAIFSKTLGGVIMSWNPAAERMYGYAAGEVIGSSVSLLLPPDRPDEIREILQRLRRGERISHFETVRVAKDGRFLHVALTISPLRDAEGNVVGASTIARDITHKKAAEQALRESERLAVAGRMAATVAHEINNPLEAVNNILYLLEHSQALSPEDRQLVQAAENELARIRQITRLTLSFYRDGDQERRPVKVTELIDNALSLYRRKLETLQIAVDKRFTGEGEIIGNSGELRQVFSNLIVNASDAMSERGTRLVIRVRDSVDWKEPARKGVRVTVGDDGAGIPDGQRRRIFELFSSTKGEHGTGVGLWVSRGIVIKHGGSIRFRSRNAADSSGTCFTVFLPSQPPEFEAAGTPAE